MSPLHPRLLNAIVLEENTDARHQAIDKLQGQIVGHFDRQVQPAARILGQQNARTVLSALAPTSLRTTGPRGRSR